LNFMALSSVFLTTIVSAVFAAKCPIGNVPCFKLHNSAADNVLMPAMGLGTGGDIPSRSSQSHPEFWNYSVGYNASLKWFDAGGRSWDAAITYESEVGVADAILKATNHWKDTKRHEIWITSKVGPWATMGYNETIEEADTILDQFDTDYIDLLLIHWPSVVPGSRQSLQANSTDPVCKSMENTYDASKCRQSSWRAMIDILKSNKARAIGVSNHEIRHIEDCLAVEDGKYPPAVNQFEFHGYWHEYDLVDYCQRKGIVVNSYAPLGTGDVMIGNWTDETPILVKHPVAMNIAGKYDKSTAQVWLKWAHQQDIVINPRTQNEEHMKENMAIFDDAFNLDMEEMLQLGSLSPVPPNPKVTDDPNTYP